ncbi:MAG: molybdopterin-synthase adenylyltransferase MoeB [Vicinamibacterales bacterium]|jgi:adenylyltransferase/sulfurtransferase|nr:molybdenum cofactor biosynthesis protein MoeB [Acidobacteriota bacterium]MDP7210525.1 molybdopterin-synthase adenylyltransferase MoeB [Vicinamibacterales bacterium]|tara:strand:+ start:3041 stop:4486 length:1446 start_codon:yes stop_codon:yes gene_type:complete
MSIKVLIPTPLRPYAGKQDVVSIDGATVGELLSNLTDQYTELRKHLYTDEGRLRSFVNVYVNDDDIRYLEREETVVKSGDTVSIVPSVAGGAGSAVIESRTTPELSNEEVQRYSRHLIMPEVGMDGQRKLKGARVLCIGAGGLGSPAAMYLAAAGVGQLGIVDFDVVDFSNLQRQILHGTPDVGRSKLQSAKDRLQAINPAVHVETYETALSSENALQLLEPYDVVVDGTDNFPTRYLVNDACVLLGKPNAYGSIFRFEGQASVFALKGGPCYRCLYPEPPPPGLVPSCAEGGVLGVLPGIIGTIQATEAIKILIGVGEPLVGRFLIFDALRMRFRELKLRRDVDCSVCGDQPTVRELVDYEQFCNVTTTPQAVVSIKEASVESLKRRLDAGDDFLLLDVREPQEHQICAIPGSTLIPLGDLPSRLVELEGGREIVVHCKSGVRSAKAVKLLQEAGFVDAANLKGGILAWIERVDPSLPKY